MTIVASVKARDGIVLATDSMSQITERNEAGQVSIIKTYSNARKLFQIRDLPIGVMSYGLGNIGSRSIENLILEFSRRMEELIGQDCSVGAVASGLDGYIRGIYEEAFEEVSIEAKRKGLRLGFFIGGYSADEYLANEWEFELPNIRPLREVRESDKFGASWRGIPLPFERLHNGFDPGIRDALKKEGVSEEIIKKVLKVDNWRIAISYDGMPVQDAINFAVYILEVTISCASFAMGTAPLCGGPLQVAAILPDKGWKWVREPELEIQ